MRLDARVPSFKRSLALTAAYVGLSALDTWLSGSTDRRAVGARKVTKPLLMPTLAASLATDEAARHSPLRTSTLVAQACGCVGDTLLLGEGTDAFAAGAGAFGLGHAAYVAGFHRSRDTTTRLRDRTTSRVALGLFATAGPAMAAGAAREELPLGAAVLGYTALVSTMFAHACHLSPGLSQRTRALTAAGAGLFLISDTILGTREFWWPTSPRRLESAVMATYTTGQLLLRLAASSA